MRESGILLPITALPTAYGVGGFSEEAFTFIDRLQEAGQTYWQVLPMGPTGYGDSPYQSFSTFAGNPYFISLDKLKEEGLLTEKELKEADCGEKPRYVDYEKLYNTRFAVLRKAFVRYMAGDTAEMQAFREENSEWLEDYALYKAVKSEQGETCWLDWPEELRNRDGKALEEKRETLAEEMDFTVFQQYLFRKQWTELKAYANSRGIRIIGDIPIYVAMDSADAWGAPELFQFDEEGQPKAVAGCPPDAFSADGQLWGNPLYNWDYHKSTGYAWWTRRMELCGKLYDSVRVDHFRGFAGYYSIPYGAPNAMNGHWEKGPGMDLFRHLTEKLGACDLIAEDLGLLTDDVRELVRDTGFPNMKVLQFAFDSGASNEYLPHQYEKNHVVYTGTHDNETTEGWLKNISASTMEYLKAYLHVEKPCSWDLIRLAMASTADRCIIPMQDYLGLDNNARMNFPSTLGFNWQWRMLDGEFTKELAARIAELTKIYNR
ncbi:MAG: 4-alpha-glucanotransferase [Eubacteriales bacterium]|nr:4-alpha-glucanotransferase [Eubacteriales bacterium]